jgi:hypothetical protein
MAESSTRSSLNSRLTAGCSRREAISLTVAC